MPDWSRPVFQWDEGDENHLIARHDIYPEEAEQVFYNGPHIRRVGDRYLIMGTTMRGDISSLFAFYAATQFVSCLAAR
jgi:hypothetical protein